MWEAKAQRARGARRVVPVSSTPVSALWIPGRVEKNGGNFWREESDRTDERRRENEERERGRKLTRCKGGSQKGAKGRGNKSLLYSILFLPQEHLSTCGMLPITCPKCEFSGKRSDVEIHVKNDCPEATVPCQFADQGCKQVVREKCKERGGRGARGREEERQLPLFISTFLCSFFVFVLFSFRSSFARSCASTWARMLEHTWRWWRKLLMTNWQQLRQHSTHNSR